MQQLWSLGPASKGERTDFLVSFGLALPSTFVGIAEGPHATFKHANGEEGRIDFVGISQRWLASDTRAWTTQEVDLATEKDDHFMVVVEVKIRERCGVPTFRRKPQLFYRSASNS